MNPPSPTQPQWQDLFRDGRNRQTIVRWNVLQKNSEPFLILPHDAPTAIAALDLYAAQTARARFGKTVLRCLFQLRLPTPLHPVAEAIDPQSVFARFLARQAGTAQFPTLAILAGNPGTPGRRFVLLLFGEQNRPVRVVKVGIGPAAIKLVQHEYQFLRSNPMPGIPKVFEWFEDETRNAFALEFLAGRSPRPGDHAPVERLVGNWIDDRRKIAVRETPVWQALEKAAAQHELMNALRRLQNLPVAATLSHGDLTPWNIKLNPYTGEAAAIDWERGERPGLPAWDWFHYLVQTGVLVKKQSPAALQSDITEFLASPSFTAYADRCGIQGLEKEFFVAYLLHAVEVLRPAEGRGTLQALLDSLSNSWIHG